MDGHVAHVGRLLSAQDVGQTQLPHVDGSLQQHLTEEEVLCRAKEMRNESNVSLCSRKNEDLLDRLKHGII